MKWRNDTNLYILILLTGAIIFAFLTVFSSATKKESLGLSARAATLYEAETDTFLFEKNADARLPMASTTKIMTALVALENSSLDDLIKIDSTAIGVEGSSAYLKTGDKLTMEELLYALLLQSANDAAVAIACYVGGDVQGFADMMNEKAEELGLSDTHFVNPHGLDDEEHYTTARDLALIAAAALKNDTFKTICSTYKKRFSSAERERNYVNHNKLLNKYFGCIGVKTGFTKRSGRCLVGAAEKEGISFISVTLDAPNDWSDHEKLLDLGFNTLERVILAEESEYTYNLPVIGGKATTVTVKNEDASSFITEVGDHDIEHRVKLSKFATAPIKEGDVFGEVIFTSHGEAVGSVRLVATENVEKNENASFFERLFGKHKKGSV